MLSEKADGKMAKAGLLRSRATDMKKSRQRRRDAGMVEFRAWVTPEIRAKLREYLKRLAK